MPRIRREGIPEPLMAHLIRRVRQRGNLSFAAWIARTLGKYRPRSPTGMWFKRFPEMIVCGEGDLMKTFLQAGQVPAGEEVM